ncbi:hypothetical protein CASFOL_026571 [Castilleja foliolosa]|uniref:Glutaredoxin domain-containing protein n=1 Tax=Castilleja foliolosa TaxID=1961234 RepID=A0ABD3CJA1_9LAMI
MGCATSKEKVCRNCQAPYSPVRRSHSVHADHRSVHKTGDHNHVAALTSSTLGSLNLDPLDKNRVFGNKLKDETPTNRNQIPIIPEEIEEINVDNKKISAKEEFETGMIEAKTWSNMINDKIPKITPKTPIHTPPGEPETINAWELMEGLEDISPLRPGRHLRSFSFQVPSNTSLSSLDDPPTPRVKEKVVDSSPKPTTWLDLVDSDTNSNSNGTSIVSEFDPDVIATFRKALEELPPANPFYLKPTSVEKPVKEFIPANKVVPRGKDKLIVYFTSLRGVRKTYEDCCHVRVILKGVGVKVDERDVSMHSGFKEELKKLLGDGFGLPRVFIGRKYIGGADEIRRLNEDGKLEKLVEGCELLNDIGGDGGQNGNVCEACGDIRFVPCETCSGSCKIYYEGEYDDDEVEEREREYGFRRCPDCNENGLIRCPICCD